MSAKLPTISNWDTASEIWDAVSRWRVEAAIRRVPVGAVGDKGEFYTVEINASNLSGKRLVELLKLIDKHGLDLTIDVRGTEAFLVLT